MIVIKKNRKEKGIRDDDFGSNPHSKGDLFSRSVIDFLDKNEAKNIITIEIIMIIDEIKKIIKIIYIKFLNFIIGSYIYFLYYINFICLINKLK